MMGLRWLEAARRRRGLALILTVTGLVAACASNKPPPTPLETIAAPTITARAAWTAKVDKVEFPLVPATSHGLMAVAVGRSLMVVQASNGQIQSQLDLGATVAAGTGFDGRRAAVVSTSGELIVTEGQTVRWRKTLGSQVATAPLVAGERVFVMGVDRIVRAYDAVNGDHLWTYQRPGDALGLLGPGVLAPFGNVLMVGQGPRLALLDPLRGTLLDEVSLASPRGTNEIERLSDLVGPMVRVGQVVCGRAFQAAVGCIQIDRGALAWSKTVGGTRAIAADEQFVVGADASDRMTAWRTRGGDTAWTHDRVLHRGLSGAVMTPKAVVFGDESGHLHFFDRASGATLGRVASDSSPIVGAPLWLGNQLIVIHRSGVINAWSVN